ncbi:MAG: hypothetical protein PVI33_02305 [Candidatus Omnitrophota bacterium]|jgi:tetratricopeptide (TPR) repeat protein
MRYNIILPILILFLLTTPVLAQEDLPSQLEKLAFLELQIGAVTTEMYMYLGWFPDNKEGIKQASGEAIVDLDEIRQQVAELKLPKQLSGLKEANLNVIDKLKEIYTGVENKESEEIKQGFVSLGGLHSQYSEKLKSALMQYRPMQELPEDFHPVDEEVKLTQNEEDRIGYLNLIDKIKKKKYRQAYQDLNSLAERYKDSAFQDCIMMRASDCLLMANRDLSEDKMGEYEEGIEILEKIMDKNSYSPVLYEVFYKWRTTNQYYNHGMSNMSQIPNKEYNERRWQIIQVIKQYLKANPEDLWAKEQVELLLSLPNITRGGLIGNSNFAHWGALYVDLSKFEEKQVN